MGLEFKELFGFVDKWSNTPFLKNPLLVSAIIIGIICIIAWFVLHNEIEIIYDDTSLPMLLFKTGILGFISTLFITFMHNKSVEQNISKKFQTVDQDRLLDDVVKGSKSDAAIKPEL